MAEAFYRLKSAGGDWTRVTGTAPITVTGLTEGAAYEYLKGDGTIGEVTAGAAATVVPSITASDSLSGRDLTISIDSLAGDPSPSVALTSLTLEGANVLGNEVGSDPWVYTVPSSSSDQAVAWTIEATNTGGTDTASGSTSVSANLFAPTATTAPTISGTLQPAETVTLREGVYSGTTPITITFTLTLDGVDVTGDVSGSDYTIPAGTDGQALVYMETANNGLAPDATQSVTRTVQAAASGSEMLLTVSGDDLVLSSPQELVLTGSDLSFVAASNTRDVTVEALDDTSTVVATAKVPIGNGALTNLGTVDGLFPDLSSGFYTFRARVETVATYTVAEAAATPTTMETSVTKDGVTFNFDEPYPVGKYANGDYFVVAPSGGSIVSTSPAAETTSATSTESGVTLVDRTINGMVANPGYRQNGWDSFTASETQTNTSYNATSNVDPGANAGAAYPFSPGETLVKAISVTTPLDSARTTIEKYVPLTVVAEAPKEGSFRPPAWGSDKDIPDSWRLDNIDWNRVPSLDLGFTPDWDTLSADALATWQTGNLWGNGVRNITPRTQPNYRKSIGEKLGDFIRALATDSSQLDKTDTMIGAIQIGIDQMAAIEIDQDTEFLNPSNRYDQGRRPITVLAATLLPEKQRIKDALELGPDGWKWQDRSSFGYITQECIDHFDDDTERGAMEGMLGLPSYGGSRPDTYIRTPANRPDLTWGTRALQGTTSATYRRIGLISEWVGVTSIHLFEGARDLYNADYQMQYNDRWLEIVEAGWPNVGGVDSNGTPTGYMIGGLPLPTADLDFFRSVRGLIDIPQTNTLGINPERPEPPELIENGTQIIVKPYSPYVGYGAPQTQMDIRYIETVNVQSDPELEPVYESVGSWTEISDARPNPNGDFLVSPTPLGGLADNTRYAVAIRYRSTNGIGPWSNNWPFGRKPGSREAWYAPWIRGISTTTTEKAAAVPSFNTPPVLDSYFTEGRPIRVTNIDAAGFPVPARSYQWSLDGTPVPGATSDTLFTSAGDSGKVPSVEVTLTNTEGTASTTITGPAITAGSADTGYRPTRYTAFGNPSIYAPASGPTAMFPVTTGFLSKATFAFWVGQPGIVFEGSFRSFISVTETSVGLNLSAGSSSAAQYSFGNFNPNQMAWYLISIDATQADPADKIKVWRKPEGSPYPPELLAVQSVTTEFAGSEFLLARTGTFAGYYQRFYTEGDEDSISALSDYWHVDGEALVPADFWNDAGYPQNVSNIGTVGDAITIPTIRMGGSQTEAQFASRENTGSGPSPLPSEDIGVLIEASGTISVGD